MPDLAMLPRLAAGRGCGWIIGATAVYCDGGLIGTNPSADGGTWAVIYVGRDSRPLGLISGIITPAEIGLPTVSNNIAELVAAVEALERLPAEWEGLFASDSHVTICRVRNERPKWKGVPCNLRHRVEEAKRRVGKRLTHRLLDGHPSREQLRQGWGNRGNPVSPWNVLCDEECNRLAAVWKAEHTPLRCVMATGSEDYLAYPCGVATCPIHGEEASKGVAG